MGTNEIPERFGKYTVERRIAVGGMAEVYLATTPPPVVRRVAIKRIRPMMATEADFVTMFIDEARVAAAFDHPNIVRVLDFEAADEATGAPYLVMEYIDGPDLRRIIFEAASKKLWIPFDIGASIVAKAARGLDYAHRFAGPDGRPLDVIHRDLSPQNIMLTTGGVVKVVDFGIAKAAGRNTRTQAGVIKGKYAYMAPEQVEGRPLDPRTDIFALGILLYEVMTYVNPFRHERDEATLLAVTGEDPVHPKERRADLPDDLCRIALKALAKDPAERFQTAGEFADAIEAAVATRRTPVTEAHLADFLEGLEAMSHPGDTPEVPPKQDKDSVISEAGLAAYARESARTVAALPAFDEGPETEAPAGEASGAAPSSGQPSTPEAPASAAATPDLAGAPEAKEAEGPLARDDAPPAVASAPTQIRGSAAPVSAQARAASPLKSVALWIAALALLGAVAGAAAGLLQRLF
ncbi:MAG: serine/threonine protein kinase [Deltaproteobacteria bacterium]|nr:MAG: serine/threonine protein kinase [Deltaproteobacteria bacterium]